MSIFEQASKRKLRFETSKGLITADDLWDLPLAASNRPNLDDIARALYKTMKEDEEISFVEADLVKKAKFNEAKLKFDVVKHIIEVKLAEAEVAKTAKATKERNQKIMELIAQKDDEALASKSKEELMAMLNE